MLTMTSLQLLLLLLSAHRQMQAFGYYDYDDVSDDNFYRRVRSVPATVCESHEEIVRWINEEVVRNAKLTGFNQRLAQLLDALNTKRPEQIGDEHCCLYEKNTMDEIFKDITGLSVKSAIAVEKPLLASGDIGTDLDMIINRLKLLAGMNMKTCCELLKDELQALEKDLLNQLENFNQKLIEKTKENTSQRDGLNEKQVQLKGKIDELKDRIDKQEQQQKDNKEKSAKCCMELDTKLNELKTDIETTKAENMNKGQELAKQLKEMQEKQKEQDGSLRNITEELEKHVDSSQKVLQNCEKTCGELENEEKDSRGIDLVDKQRFENLEKSVKEFSDKLNDIKKLNETTQQCKRIKDDLTNLEETIKKIQKQNQATETNVCPSTEELKSESDKAKSCCTKIDKLNNDAKQMELNITEMGKSYKDHGERVEADLKDLQKRLDEDLQKSSKGPNSVADRIKRLQAQISKTKKELTSVQNRLDKNDDKLNDIQNTLNQQLEELRKLNEDRNKKVEELKLQTEQKLKELDDKLNTVNKADNGKPDDEIIKRLELLEKNYGDLRNDLDKALQLEKRVDDMEKQLKDALEKLNNNDAKVSRCLIKCKGLDKLDDLIDRIEDVEKIASKAVGRSSAPTTLKTTKKPIRKRTVKPKERYYGRPESIIGGIDFYDQ